MSTNTRSRFFGRDKKKTEKEKVKIDAEEKLFLISLYPKGRVKSNIFEQLKNKFTNADERILRDRMNKWIVRMHSYGMIYIIPTENIGEVVSLTKRGIDYAKKKIHKMLKKDTAKFVKIINRLMQEGDEWTLKYYNNQSEKMVSGYLPLYAVIFDPKPLSSVIRDLKNPFGLKLDDIHRQKKFEDDIRLMEAFGLIDIVYDNENTILVASSVAKKVYAKLVREKLSGKIKGMEKTIKKTKKKTKKSLEKTILLHDKFTLISVVISLIITFIVIVNSFPIEPATNQLLIDNHYQIYGFLFIPLLVLIFYIVISKGYYIAMDKLKIKKKH